jgi:hypothetical protein
VTICSCSALCLIGDGGNSTSHGVCRHIDDRGIDGDSISRGVGGLVDNRVYGDLVSGSVGSLVESRVVRLDDIECDEEQHEVYVSGANTMYCMFKMHFSLFYLALNKPKEPVKRCCINTINTSLSTWSQESRGYLAEFVKNIKEGDIIYWAQGLCANREKSLALGERGLEGLDRTKCPSANFNDNILKPVAASLRAKGDENEDDEEDKGRLMVVHPIMFSKHLIHRYANSPPHSTCRSEAQLPEKSQYIHCQRVIASSLESGMTTSTYEYCRRRLSRERIVECYWFHIPLLLERCLHSKWAVHRRGTSTVRSPSTVAVDDMPLTYREARWIQPNCG